ncbi:MAG: redoxin domain-containing protein [Thermoplasmata archaeon]|nr:redoxin domain-containing protein [Thermoplasmata archaeon]
MRRILFIPVILLLLLSGAMTGCIDNKNEGNVSTGIKWTDYEKGMEQANESKKPAILYFYSPKLSICKDAENKIFSNDEVKKETEDFVMIKINVDENKNYDILTSFRFQYMAYVPTVIFLNESGVELHRLIAYDFYNPDNVRESITNFIKNMEKAKEGKIWGDDFTFVTLDGGIKHLSDFRGKVVIIDLMATWCGPCRMQMAELEKVLSHYKEDNVLQIISIDVDSRDTADEIKSTFGDHINEWAFGMDMYGVSKKLVLEGAIPTLAIYDRHGRIMYLRPGLIQSQQLISILNEIIPL